jgi:hypothetical protein
MCICDDVCICHMHTIKYWNGQRQHILTYTHIYIRRNGWKEAEERLRIDIAHGDAELRQLSANVRFALQGNMSSLVAVLSELASAVHDRGMRWDAQLRELLVKLSQSQQAITQESAGWSALTLQLPGIVVCLRACIYVCLYAYYWSNYRRVNRQSCKKVLDGMRLVCSCQVLLYVCVYAYTYVVDICIRMHAMLPE